MSNIFSAPLVELKELKNLFIELTARNCNQKCKHCYIDFPVSRTVRDFIEADKIKEALEETRKGGIECIYLTGAEPMTHPEFNSILRMCLKYSSVCICTNASFINEKKARFLKKVEDEGSNEIIFKLSIDHYNEIKNDDIRGRGAYRQTLNAVKCLIKYNFNPIFSIVNYYNEDKKVLIGEFKKICQKIGFDVNDFNFQINEYYNKYKASSETFDVESTEKLDCKYGRILTQNGIYVCPFLANDHRGWMGTSLKDYSKKIYLETTYCQTCIKNKNKLFAINFD